MYAIEWSTDAEKDLSHFRRHEQVRILDAVTRQLPFEPTVATPKRKRLRPNRTAEWELRIGDFRVFYDVDDQVRVVAVALVGEKRGNQLFVRGQRKEI